MSNAKGLTRERVQFLAALVGLDFSDDRAEALAIQAAPHFELISSIENISIEGSEPAADFRLDYWRRPDVD